MAFDHRHYVPILKWKRGEKVGLENCHPNVKEKLTPLVEIVPLPWDYENDCYSKTIDQHLDGVATGISEAWGTTRAILLDGKLVEDEIMDNGSHSMRFIMEDCLAQNVKLIPVTGYGRSEGYQNVIREAVQRVNRGLCLRMADADFPEMNDRILALIADFSVRPEQVDLVIDLGAFDEHETGSRTIAAISLINSLPCLQEWRTVTLAGSAFPSNLGEVDKNSLERISRVEWGVWTSVSKKAKRKPTYGDYAIAHPHYTEVDPRLMQMSGNIRYTSTDCWVIVKGVSTKKHGFDQMINLCRRLLTEPEYCGASFSWGDEYISECAQLNLADRRTWKKGNATTGNAETWRRVGTNHHLTFVASQIASAVSP